MPPERDRDPGSESKTDESGGDRTHSAVHDVGRNARQKRLVGEGGYGQKGQGKADVGHRRPPVPAISREVGDPQDGEPEQREPEPSQPGALEILGRRLADRVSEP